MAFIKNCFCCSLPIACGFFAAYLLITYLIAFAFEILWIILESSNYLPTAAVLLSAGYFSMSLFAALLLHGLATKSSVCLVTWMFAVTILTFPEAGLVIYMSVSYWGTEHIYGKTELSCWLFRIIVNVIQIILIQSLYTLWKDEDLINKRIQELSGIGVENLPPLNSQYYYNTGYNGSVKHFNDNMKRYGSMPLLWNNMHLMTLPMSYGDYFSPNTNEFNASVYVSGIDKNETPEKKAQSLMDLRYIDPPDPNLMYGHQSGSINDSGNIIMPPPMFLDDTSKKKAMSEINYSTLPLKMSRCRSVEPSNRTDKSGHIISNRSGFYAQPMESYGVPIYYGPLEGPDFLIYKKQQETLTSKNSLSNNSAEDVML